MADSETRRTDDEVDFPFEEDYRTGAGWIRFLTDVFNRRFAGEAFRVRMVTSKEKRNGVKDYTLSFLAVWHLTDMAYDVKAPSIHHVVREFEDPAWRDARLVHMCIVGVGNRGEGLRIRFELA